MKNTTKTILVLFISLICISASSQPFQNENGNFNLDEISFDPWFISKNHISEVHVEYSRKLPGDPIESIPDEDFMEFDALGRCVNGFSKRSTRLGTDSISFSYSFKGDQLLEYRSNDGLGSYSEIYTIEQSDPGVVQVDYQRNGNYVNKETRKSQHPNDTLTITRVYNSDDIHFKTIRTYRDSRGRTLELSEDFQFSGKKNTERREYNENGWVSVCYKNFGDRSEYTTYEYSQLGELLMVHYYKDQKRIHSLEILYADGFPEALIKKEYSTNRLRIAKFEFKREH